MGVASSTVMSLAFQTGYIVAFCYGAIQISRKMITYGTMSVFLTLVNRVQAPVMGLAQQIPKVVSILASAGRIMELQQIPLEMKTDTQIPSARIGVEIKDMTFGYTDETVLENVNLRISPGEFVAIIGESGIGKTTLIRIIMSFMSNIRGSVTFLMKKGIWNGRMPLPGNLYLMYPRGIHCSAVRCGEYPYGETGCNRGRNV